MPLQELEQALNYTFSKKEYLSMALKHSSVSTNNNERMEFLGDRVLGFVISEYLYNNFTKEKEGYLAKACSYLTSQVVLLMVANTLKLADHIDSQQSLKEDSLIADALEALLAAIYLDSNLVTVKNLILHLWQPYLSNYNEEEVHSSFNPKSLVQEWAQKAKLGIPKYKIVEKSGEDHAPIFYVSLEIGDYPIVVACGSNLKNAEKTAALQFIKDNNISM